MGEFMGILYNLKTCLQDFKLCKQTCSVFVHRLFKEHLVLIIFIKKDLFYSNVIAVIDLDQ